MTDLVKTWGGVAVAGIKTYSGITAASVKSIGGISVSGGGGSYTTFNSANKSANITLTGGDLIASCTTANQCNVYSVAGKSTGKWYYEIYVNTIGAIGSDFIGIIKSTTMPLSDGQYGKLDNQLYYSFNGSRYHDNTSAAYGASWTTGNYISVAFDADAGTVYWWKDGAAQAGGTISGLAAGTWHAHVNLYSNTAQVTANFGASAFQYTPPTGYGGWTA